MIGYLPILGDVVRIPGVAGTYTVLAMQDYYHHSPMNSEVALLREDGTEAWDILGGLILVSEGTDAKRATEHLIANHKLEWL